MTFVAVLRGGLPAEVADKIREVINTGRVAPGEKLPPEREMARQLGVNRGTLREALVILRCEGRIATRQGSGNRVLRVESER